MPRNPSGIYSLPSGNPVVSGTLIEASWANNTLSDLANSMTDSLSRSGEGGMTAPLRLSDGSLSTPGMAFSSETSTGFYRAGSGDVRLAITGSQLVQFLGTGVAITGTLSASGNLSVNTDKFTVAASSGNTAVAGTLAVTGTSNFTGAITATGGVVGAVTGNASTATALQTARTIWGQSFDGTANVSGALTGVSDITASGSVTLNGGTANGVPYLNGSKVLTSGSALTFDGTNFVVGSSQRLLVGRTTSDANGWGMQNYGASAYTSGLQLTYAGVGASAMWVPAASALAFGADGASGTTELMRLTSTGLGIGTSSFSRTLTLNSASTPYIGYQVAGTEKWVVGVDSNGRFIWYDAAAASTRATIDSSGNLGLGVTPSAWGGAAKAIDITGFGSVGGSTGFQATSNSFFNGTNWIYKNTASAALYTQNASVHAWYTAPSGTAGDPITFTQAMTLDASGNLLVGTTTSSGRLTVMGDGTANASILVANSNRSTTNAGVLSLYGYNSTPAVKEYGRLYSTIDTNTAGSEAGSMVFQTINAGTLAERARIDSSGNLIQSAPTTPPSLSTNGTMVFNLTSNTNLRVSVRGSDGVTRTANITLA
jgi:hypothetical protein